MEPCEVVSTGMEIADIRYVFNAICLPNVHIPHGPRISNKVIHKTHSGAVSTQRIKNVIVAQAERPVLVLIASHG